MKKKEVILSDAKRREEFDRLFLKYEKTVARYILRMTGDADAVEDISQNTFMALYRKMERALASENIAAWLLEVAENEVKHYQRKWARRYQCEVGMEECPEVAATPPETREEFLSGLPDWVDERDRKILLWYYYDEYKLVDIAPKVGLTHRGLRVHMSRLHVKLRESGIDWNN